MNESTRQTVWSLAAGAAAVLFLIAWSITPPRTAAPGPRPAFAEADLCRAARGGASPDRVRALVQGGGAVHSGVAAAAGQYAGGRGLISEIVTACASVGA